MDVLPDSGLTLSVKTSQTDDAIAVEEPGVCEQSGDLSLHRLVDAALSPSLPQPAAESSQRVCPPHQSSTPASPALCFPLPLGTDPSLSLTAAPSHEVPNVVPLFHDMSSPASLPNPAGSSWGPAGDTQKSIRLPAVTSLSMTMMEPDNVSTLAEECLLQPTRTCLGCFIETRDATSVQNPPHEPSTSPNSENGLSVRIGDVNREDFSDINNISIQCLSHAGEAVSHYGEQLLSDQLLSFPLPKAPDEGKRAEGNKATNDCDDPEDDATTKNLYEGLLLDKVSGEEVLLANASQDWGYFESFISESKMELLDLCSKNELSVNLFSEEDVDNLFDDEDDDSTLSSDVCSLKIRYESFQDNMREKTNVLQEETQLNFFPSVLANSAKKEEGVGVLRRSVEELQPKIDELVLETGQEETPGDCNGQSPLDGSQCSPMSPPKINYVIDFNSTEESGEFSDDSSCTGSSSDTVQEGKYKKGHSKRFFSPSNPLNYGLRSKRKVRYSDDYLYDVDSLESEKNAEKKDKTPLGQKEEEDVDWCPKKRRKSCRKDPPVVIKYIIINRFKGERLMSVKLGKLNPADGTVSLNANTISKYETLAPLKDFWQEKQRKRQEQLKLVSRERQRGFHLNGRHHRPFHSNHPKRKYKFANRIKVQRIHTVQQTVIVQNSLPADQAHGDVTKDQATPMVEEIIAAPGIPLTLDINSISNMVITKSRSQEREEREGRRLGGNKIVRIRKFKSEARLRSQKMNAAQEQERKSVTNESDTIVATANADDPSAGLKDTSMSAATAELDFSDNATTIETDKEKQFVSSSDSPDKAPSSEEVETGVSVIPGGYLQTLLDATDSSGGTSIPYFSQHSSRQQYPVGLSLEEKQFSSLQLAQSCVLSPPSESELQQSPQNCPSFPQMWHPQLCNNHNQNFGPETPETPILPNNFPTVVPLNENLPVSNYSHVDPEGEQILYEKSYLTEPGLQSGADLQVCQSTCSDGQVQYQRGSLCTDNGRLISYDSVGSLSASSNYSSLSLKSCEREGEEEGRDSFLAHCSPKMVIQQSVDALTPLRESSDLLDISNFTPDKFRHSSLSELSPPETPNLSPQVAGRDMKIPANVGKYQDVNDLTVERNRDVKWNCDLIQQQEHTGNSYTVEDSQFPLHNYNNQDVVCVDTKELGVTDFDEQTDEMAGPKSIKAKRKGNYKQTAAGQSPKKVRAPRTPKSEKVKSPKPNSRSTKKIKAMLEGKAAKNQADGCGIGLPDSTSTGDWSGPGWSESNSLVGDDQREFEEPSNILSNIVSGMAEVQRFMMASIEPLWNPMSEAGMPAEANSLNLKTLKILAGTESDLKKKGAMLTGAGRGRKAGGKGGKNQAKFNPTHPLFPQLALGCDMFDKPNFINPGPAHKKLYRHKTSAKFPRIETLKGKRAERDPNKDIALMTSFEKLRMWMSCCCRPSYTAWLISRGKPTLNEPYLIPRHLENTRWDRFVSMTYQMSPFSPPLQVGMISFIELFFFFFLGLFFFFWSGYPHFHFYALQSH
ncbi:neurite extension and migration factor isoform X1 [Nerophis ophidion]|uniref:neurite extension and migration factor isoform X1 n=2 Tax=Nerophis ophidion TaxID=159077 RepID=UPI002ADFC57C|nr:neurite extension and migration factor isoform X1 [Nerophis ophidion]XP_061755662.1 neurite extension and migration factor isoform X1 [Nerophis ophidion]XP_061755663.1 neurite extension and migration factor isoform X1 [Nerophis ophidion]